MSKGLEFDYAALKKRYLEVFGTQEAYAKSLGIDRTSLIKRLNNELPFKADEIMKSIQLLGLSPDEIETYFFTQKVEKAQPITA